MYTLALAVCLMADQSGGEELYVALNDHERLGTTMRNRLV
jgi:hypothetical protein